MSAGADSQRDYRRRRRRLRIVWMAALPTVVLVLVFGAHPASWAAGMVWLVAFVLADVHFEAWPCPRCGKSFFRRGVWHNSFARSCLNCGLPRPAPDAAVIDGSEPVA